MLTIQKDPSGKMHVLKCVKVVGVDDKASVSVDVKRTCSLVQITFLNVYIYTFKKLAGVLNVFAGNLFYH